MTTPSSPTAQTLAPSAETARSVAVTSSGGFRSTQVPPPLVVLRIAAPLPTAHPWVSVAKYTARRSAEKPVGTDCTAQLLLAGSRARMRPALPTAQPRPPP